MRKLFCVSCEASGDVILSKVLRRVSERWPRSVEVAGVFGRESEVSVPHESIVPLEDLSVMGIGWPLLRSMRRLSVCADIVLVWVQRSGH